MPFRAFHEVDRDVARFQSGRVNRRLFGTLRQDHGLATVVQYGVQSCIGPGLAQESLGSHTERGVVNAQLLAALGGSLRFDLYMSADVRIGIVSISIYVLNRCLTYGTGQWTCILLIDSYFERTYNDQTLEGFDIYLLPVSAYILG